MLLKCLRASHRFPLSLERKGKESAAMKADLLRARDMKRYINQLTVAKKQSEKRIRLLGGPNYENNEDGGADDSDEPQSQKVGLVGIENFEFASFKEPM